MINSSPVSVLDYGADPTGTTDSAPAIQNAIIYCLTNRKELYIPAGNYLIASINGTFGGKNYAMLANNASSGLSYLYNPLRIYGAGYWTTKLLVTSNVSLDYVFGIVADGEGMSFSDIGISVASSIPCSGLYVAGAGPNVIERVWSDGGIYNFLFQGGEPSATDIIGEFASDTGVYINEVYAGSFDKVSILSSTNSGITVYNTATGSGNVEYQIDPAINISNFKVNGLSSFGSGSALTIHVERAAYTAVNLVNGQLGNNGFQVGAGSPASNVTQYSYNITTCSSVSFTNVHFVAPQYGGILENANSVKFVNCTFSKTGFTLNPTTGTAGTTWACRDIYIGDNVSSVSVVDCLFDTSSGNAIYANGARNLTVIGNKFIDVSNGGLNTSAARNNAANSTVGNSNIYIKPADVNGTYQIIGNYFEAPAAYSSGKYGIVIDGTTAVPAAGNVNLTNNTNYGNDSFGGNFYTPSITNLQKNAWSIINDGMATATPQPFPTYANADAPNSTLYFSSTASKLVWKDSSGTVNNLY